MNTRGLLPLVTPDIIWDVICWLAEGIPLDSPIFQFDPPPMGSCLREGVFKDGRLWLIPGAGDPWNPRGTSGEEKGDMTRGELG